MYGFSMFFEFVVKLESEVSIIDDFINLSGVCNLCNGGVRFVRANDRNRCVFFLF